MSGDKKNDTKVSKRSEAELGKIYERNVFALISLKCLIDPDIANFWIASNVKDINKFDDIVLNVTLKDDNQEIFLIQAKSKKNCCKPVVAEMFHGDQKDFSLNMFQQAYESIIDNDKILEFLDCDSNRKLFFVLFNNSQVSQNYKNKSLSFENIDKHNFKPFITSRSYEQSSGYTINDKTGSYNKNFLKNFYFYAEQMDLEDLLNTMKEILSGEVTSSLVNEYIYNFYDPINNNTKLTKLDLTMKILSSSSVFGNFKPDVVESVGKNILTTLKNFDVTLITETRSEVIVWSEILCLMKRYYDTNLDFSDWNNILPDNVRDKITKKYPELLKQILNVKNLYLFMVANSELPFYKKTHHKSGDTYIYELLKKLGIYSVIYNTNKTDKISFPDNIKVFESMYDMDDKIFETAINKIFISFRKTKKISLNEILERYDIDKHISADQYIQLYMKIIKIDNINMESKIYINRSLKKDYIRLDLNDISNNGECTFIIFNVPKRLQCKYFQKCINFDNIDNFKEHIDKPDNNNAEIKVDSNTLTTTTPQNYDSDSNVEIEMDSNILTITTPYNYDLLQIVQRKYKTFCIIQYESSNVNYNLIFTNGYVDHLRYSKEQYSIRDMDLVKNYGLSNTNIICNNAGMGKSMLLQYFLKIFPSGEWLVYLELSKYISALKYIKNFDDLTNFIYEKDLVGSVDESFKDSLYDFYKSYIKNRKLVILIDDFEEICEKQLLNVFKEAADKGLRLWIVARPGHKEEYEKCFGVFSWELTEFTAENQIQFFKKFFKTIKRSNLYKLKRIKEITDSLDTSFIGICQQTMMLAEIFKDNPKSKIKSTSQLYENYLTAIIKKYDMNANFIFKTISKLALTSFFSEDILKNVFDWFEYECDLNVLPRDKNPVVEFKVNCPPVFSHKTYAEYLAARWLSLNVKKEVFQETPFKLSKLIKYLYKGELLNVRWFFDKILSGAPIIKTDTPSPCIVDYLGRNIFHYDITYGERFEINNADSLDTHTNLEIHFQNNEILLTVPVTINKYQKSPFDNIFTPDTLLLKRHFDIQRLTFGQLENTKAIQNSATNSTSLIPVSSVERYLSVSPDILLNKQKNFTNINLVLEVDNYLRLTPIEYGIEAGTLRNIEEYLKFDVVYSFVNFSELKTARYFMLYHAAQNGFSNILRKLLDDKHLKKEVVTIRDSTTRMSLLHLAVKYHHQECISQLLVHPISKYGQDIDGNTPLHLAGNWKDPIILKILKKLTKQKSEFINVKNNQNQSILYTFTQAKNTEAVKILANCKEIDIDAVDRDSGNSAFITSIYNKSTEIFKILHECGSNVNLKNHRGMTALHFSVLRGSEKNIKRLFEWKADINCQNEYGFTPLIFAARLGKANIVLQLLDQNADVDLQDKNKWTALHHAVKMKHSNIVSILLEHNAKINIPNKKCFTPLMEACNNNSVDIVEILLNYNAKIEYTSKYSKCTALNICKQKGHKECQAKIEEKKLLLKKIPLLEIDLD